MSACLKILKTIFIWGYDVQINVWYYYFTAFLSVWHVTPLSITDRHLIYFKVQTFLTRLSSQWSLWNNLISSVKVFVCSYAAQKLLNKPKKQLTHKIQYGSSIMSNCYLLSKKLNCTQVYVQRRHCKNPVITTKFPLHYFLIPSIYQHLQIYIHFTGRLFNTEMEQIGLVQLTE